MTNAQGIVALRARPEGGFVDDAGRAWSVRSIELAPDDGATNAIANPICPLCQQRMHQTSIRTRECACGATLFVPQ